MAGPSGEGLITRVLSAGDRETTGGQTEDQPEIQVSLEAAVELLNEWTVTCLDMKSFSSDASSCLLCVRDTAAAQVNPPLCPLQ